MAADQGEYRIGKCDWCGRDWPIKLIRPSERDRKALKVFGRYSLLYWLATLCFAMVTIAATIAIFAYALDLRWFGGSEIVSQAMPMVIIAAVVLSLGVAGFLWALMKAHQKDRLSLARARVIVERYGVRPDERYEIVRNRRTYKPSA